MNGPSRAPISFQMLKTRCPRCGGNVAPCDPRYEDGVAMCICCGRRFGGYNDLPKPELRKQKRQARLPVGG